MPVKGEEDGLYNNIKRKQSI